MKKIALSLMLVSVMGCQIKTRTADPVSDAPGGGPSVISGPDVSAPTQVESALPAAKPGLKLGVILGAGGARTFSQIGFLKQLQMKRIPVHAIVGLEWGAVVAASFAAKGSAHEAEWQLSKLKGLEQGWFSEGGSDAKNVLDPLQSYFSAYKAESLKVPFGCPSLNLKKSQVYMMARGRLDQLLPFCLAYPPSLKPYDRSIAAVREIQTAVDYLRNQGASHIVFVNVLGQINQNEAVHWLELSYDMKRKWPGVHERLDLVMGGKSLVDFKSRQEMIESGMEQSAGFVERLAGKL